MDSPSEHKDYMQFLKVSTRIREVLVPQKKRFSLRIPSVRKTFFATLFTDRHFGLYAKMSLSFSYEPAKKSRSTIHES